MRIAILSDIHGNAFALKAVLEHLRTLQIDKMVNLGDIFYGPVAPRATYDLLQEYEFVTIRGNQDRQIYESTDVEIEANPTMGFVLNELQGEPLTWLKNIPVDLQLDDRVYLCHGGPNDDMMYLVENIRSGSSVVRPDKEILKRLEGQKSSLILCGHTLIPRSILLSSGQQIVNPGSVGLPAYFDDLPVNHSMENYSYHASFAVIERQNDGWLVEHYKLPYDVEAAAEECLKRRRDDWAYLLRTGRVEQHL